MAQKVEDPALSLQWLGLLLWLRFDPWPGHFHMSQAEPKKLINFFFKRKKWPLLEQLHSVDVSAMM